MANFKERVILYAMLTSLTSLSIDALLPASRQIEAELGASSTLGPQHVITLFILGMAIGELILGPVSDAIGRKKSLLMGLCIYGSGTLLSMMATSLELLILGRVIQGIGVAGPKIATRAMIRDQFEGDAMARIMSLIFSIFMLVPMVAPMLAQGLVTLAGWRSIFLAYLVIAAVLAAWLFARHAETLPEDRRVPFRPSILALNAARILSNKRVLLLILTTGIVFGAQLLFLSTSTEVLADAYGIEETFPVYFAILASAIGLASLANARLVQRYGMQGMARAGFIGLIFSGSAMLIAILAVDLKLPLNLFMIFTFGAFFAIGILFGNLNAMAMRSLADVAGLGTSLIASGSSLVATIFAMVFGSFYDEHGIYLASGFLIAGICAFTLAEYAARADGSAVIAIR